MDFQKFTNYTYNTMNTRYPDRWYFSFMQTCQANNIMEAKQKVTVERKQQECSCIEWKQCLYVIITPVIYFRIHLFLQRQTSFALFYRNTNATFWCMNMHTQDIWELRNQKVPLDSQKFFNAQILNEYHLNGD